MLVVPAPSVHFRFADKVLEGSLVEFLTDARAKRTSWERIARELFTISDGEIDVTGMTVQNWFEQFVDHSPTETPETVAQ